MGGQAAKTGNPLGNFAVVAMACFVRAIGRQPGKGGYPGFDFVGAAACQGGDRVVGDLIKLGIALRLQQIQKVLVPLGVKRMQHRGVLGESLASINRALGASGTGFGR